MSQSKCVNCGQSFEVKSQNDLDLDYCCPVAICPCCGANVLIEGKKEIALSGISFWDRLPIRPFPLIIILAGIVLLLTMVYSDGSVTIIRPKSLIFGAIALVAGVVWTFMDVKNYSKRLQAIKQEKVASEKRCANKEYVEVLMGLGYKVKK